MFLFLRKKLAKVIGNSNTFKNILTCAIRRGNRPASINLACGCSTIICFIAIFAAVCIIHFAESCCIQGGLVNVESNFRRGASANCKINVPYKAWRTCYAKFYVLYVNTFVWRQSILRNKLICLLSVKHWYITFHQSFSHFRFWQGKTLTLVIESLVSLACAPINIATCVTQLLWVPFNTDGK